MAISARRPNEIEEKFDENPEKETLLQGRQSAQPKIIERRLSQPAEQVFHYEHQKELFPEPDMVVEEDLRKNDENIIDWSKG